MFIEQIKSNIQSVMTHDPYPPETQKAESAGFYYGGDNYWPVKYRGLRPNPPLFPRHNNLE